jgi:MoaA/NifB/PqqE/SkfB family radical SAM enzyme
MKTNETIIADIRNKAVHRNIYIWGAGIQGLGISFALQRLGIPLAGFIDSSTALQGKTKNGFPICSPDKVLSEGSPAGEKPFIIISVFFFEKEITERCLQAGFRKGDDFIFYTAIKPFDYAVDVSGVCNLRCIACPRGNPGKKAHAGYMSFADYRKVIEKILREDPFVGSVQLYQWGEPLLNKSLPEMITWTNEQNIRCAVSSNLNYDADYEKVIKAGPAWFRVSVSGFGKNYEVTHTGGRWEVFLKNLHQLGRLRRDYCPEMKTEVYYHVYRNNAGDEYLQMKKLCEEELDFEFHPVPAYLISLDDILSYLEGNDLNPSARKAVDLMVMGLDESIKMAMDERSRECLAMRCIHINWNLAVSNCMMFYYPDGNIAADNFLDTSMEEIMKRRKSCNLCRRCLSRGLHRYCSAHSTLDLNLKTGP